MKLFSSNRDVGYITQIPLCPLRPSTPWSACFVACVFCLLCLTFNSHNVYAETELSSQDVKSLLSQARSYESGLGQNQDYKQAFILYQRAAEVGSAKAQRIIGSMYEMGRGVRADYKQAAYWYEKAASQGQARSKVNLGNLYEKGFGVEQDYDAARNLYEQAASRGYARGMFALGKLYEQGLGVELDYGLALSWYKKAADLKYSRGQVALGTMYEHGLGVEQDNIAALKWYEKASRKGFPDAIEAVHLLQGKMAKIKPESKSKPIYEPENALVVTSPAAEVVDPLVAQINTIARDELDMPLLLQMVDRSVTSFSLFSELMAVNCSDFNLNCLEQQVLSAKSLERDADAGITFESGYRVRDGDYLGNRNRAFAGLAWDVFEEGLVENNSLAKRYQYKKQIAEVEAAKDRNKELFTCRNDYLISYFQQLKINVLRTKVELLRHYYDLQRQAYFVGDILYDDLLKIEEQLFEAIESVKNYEMKLSYDYVTPKIVADYKLPLLDFNFPALLQAVDEDATVQEIVNLEKDFLREKYRSVHDKTLKFYVTGGFGEAEGEFSSGDVTAGVYFSTPLTLRSKDEVLHYELLRSDASLKKKQETARYETGRLYNAYGEKLRDAIKFYHKWLISGERTRRLLIRQEQFRQEFGRYALGDHQKLLQYLLELLDLRREFIAIQESLYRKMLHTFTLTGTGYKPGFIKVADAAARDFYRARYGSRAVYMWSSSFNRYDNRFILDVCQAKALQTVIVSVGVKADENKLAEFVSMAARGGVDVELMIGDRWIPHERWDNLFTKITFLANYSNRLHLDIEPHTLADFKQKKDEYLNGYLVLITKIKERFPDLSISVSLPMSYGPSYLAKVSGLVDKIYIMAYGINNISTMARRTANYSDLPGDKLVLALRPDDFANELLLENFVGDSRQNLGYQAFAFHDFKQLLNMFMPAKRRLNGVAQ